MMENLLKAMDDTAMDDGTKSAKEVNFSPKIILVNFIYFCCCKQSTLVLLKSDREMRKQKIGAIFHKLQEKFQLNLVRGAIKTY